MAENDRQDTHPLPDGWAWTTIGESVRILDSQRVPVNAQERTERIAGKSKDELYPYYGATGQVGWIDDYLFDEELVLLGEDGAPFLDPFKDTAYMIRGKAWVNNHAHVLRMLAGLNSYLCHYLNTVDYKPYVTGTTRLKLNQARMRTIPIPLAPLSEQRRIVEAIETQLTRLDAAVAALERVQANLARYRASVLQAACEGRLVPTEAELARDVGATHASPLPHEPADVLLERILDERRARWEEERWAYEIERAKKKAAQAERKAAGLPYYIRDLKPEHWQHRTPEEYEPYLPKSDKWKQKYDEPEPPDTENLPELPEGWCWASLEQVITFSQNGFGKRRSKTGDPTIVLRLADIEEGQRISLDNVRRIRMTDKEIEKYQLLENDLLCIRVNGSPDLVGRFVPFEGADEPIAFCDHFIRFRFAMPSVTSFFLLYSDTRQVRRYIDLNKVSSAGQNTVSQTTISSLVFPLPPLAEQRRIVAEVERRLSVVRAMEAAVEANLVRARRLRQSILKRAFEGRLVPQDPEDEPASVLLERIK